MILVFAAVAVVTACSSSSSLTDFAEDLEDLVGTLNGRLAVAEGSLGEQPSLETMQSYVTVRMDLRDVFLDDFRNLDAPDEVADLYVTALDIITRLTAAEAEVADLVLAADTAEEANAAWDGPAGDAARAVDAESQAICDAAQANLDATKDRDEFSDTPWVPPEMKEVVEVTFRCRVGDR